MKKKAKKISPALGATPQVESADISGNPQQVGPAVDGRTTGRENLQPSSVSGNSKGKRSTNESEGSAAVSANNTAAPGLGRSLALPEPRPTEPLIKFRPYQQPVFADRTSGILLLHWSRQIGKSYTLASWAVDRLLTRPGRLVTVLSNSRDNGAEFVQKCAEICLKLGLAEAAHAAGAPGFETEDMSTDLFYENMRMEVRITVGGKAGRIKVLAANPRTARGFSGDLILDEFAFHEDSNAIWEAAEPILSSSPDFLCRIASTGNGTHNMFYRMSAGDGLNDGRPFVSPAGFKVCRVTRSEAWKQGVKVYDPNTRKPITPVEARAKSLDKRAYDQNYECKFNAENMCLLTHELISAAESDAITIDDQKWSAQTLERLTKLSTPIVAGQDIGRNRDLSVVVLLSRVGLQLRVVGMLRMSGMSLPDQQDQVNRICRFQQFRGYCGDMTGLGLGLVEYLQRKWGDYRIKGVNFSTTEPITDAMRSDGDRRETAKVTEIMATRLLEVFNDRSIQDLPMDQELRDDLRKPEKITSPGGKVSIAAVRDEAGHADHFWGLALAIRAAQEPGGVLESVEGIRTGRVSGRRPTFKPRIWRAA
jgi:phage FluMu gp28-like protein